MRIGLLTYHHVVNIGSVLQTYCSYNLLTRLYPQAQVEVIDHVPAVSEAFKARQRRSTKGKGLFAKVVENDFIRSERAYDRFLRERCAFGPSLPVGLGVYELMGRISDAAYDMVVVGSDTVFQLDGYFGEPIADALPPNAYYLPGLSGPRKVGLAVSFDPYVGGAQERERLGTVRQDLGSFDRILYRDATAEGLLTDAGYRSEQMAHVPDPTILMDITHLVPTTTPPSSRRERPLAGVAVADPGLYERVAAIVAGQGFEVIDYMHPPGAEVDLDDPAAVVGNALRGYQQLDLMVTDRFHGSILTLQVSAANLIGIENADRYQLPNSKLRDLFERLGIGEHLVRCGSSGPEPALLERLVSTRSWNRGEMMRRMAALRASGFASVAALLGDPDSVV